MLTKTLIFLVIALHISCAGTADSENKLKSDQTADNFKHTCPIISSETAIDIAKGILCLDYDLRNRKITVETETELWKDKGEMWKVTFYGEKVKDSWGGGDPIVWIFKHNGERFTVKHAK